jgi:hypothetical protein
LEQQQFDVQQHDVDQEHQQLQMKYGFSDKVRMMPAAAGLLWCCCFLQPEVWQMRRDIRREHQQLHATCCLWLLPSSNSSDKVRAATQQWHMSVAFGSSCELGCGR